MRWQVTCHKDAMSDESRVPQKIYTDYEEKSFETGKEFIAPGKSLTVGNVSKRQFRGQI